MVKQDSKQAQYTYQPPTSQDLLGEFVENNRSYQLFLEKGLDKEQVLDDELGKCTVVQKILDNSIYKPTLRFLSAVDPSKGSIQRKVTRMERRRDLNPNTHKMEEHLVVHVDWIGKDYLGNELVNTTVKEGVYNQPIVNTVLVKGKTQSKYQNWKAVYDIPFTPQAVNEALDNQLNPPELINYFVRVTQTQRDNTFSLEQFRDSTFEECQEISKQGKGANR